MALGRHQAQPVLAQRLRGLQRVGGNAPAHLLQDVAHGRGVQRAGALGRQRRPVAVGGNGAQRRMARVEIQRASVAMARHPGRFEAAPALRIVQHQGHAARALPVQPDATLHEPAFALDHAQAGHQPFVLDQLAAGLHFGLVHGPAQRGHHVGLDLGAERFTAAHGVDDQLPVAQLHQHVAWPVAVAVHQIPAVLDACRHARGLRIDHARGHGVPALAHLGVAGLVGQARAHHVLHPQRQFLQARLDLVPALVFAPGLLPGRNLGIGWRLGRRGGSLGLLLLGLFLAAVQPGLHPGRWIAALGDLAARTHQHQRQPMLAGELAAGARAFEGGARQVHLGLVGLAAAALALAPHRHIVGTHGGPFGGRLQPLGGLAGGSVRR